MWAGGKSAADGGTLLGTLTVTPTGGFGGTHYQTQPTSLSTSLTGLRDVFLVFSGSVNLDWFQFTY